MPSYEDRMVQMESVLKNSVTHNFYGELGRGPRYVLHLTEDTKNSCTARTPSAEILKELSDSQYTVYDVLPTFFNHADPMVSLGMFDEDTMIYVNAEF